MNVSSHNLAVDIAERLNDFAPDGLSIGSVGKAIEVYSGDRMIGGSPALGIIDENDDRSVTAKIETAVRAALDGIQDVIIEDIHRPWPGPPGPGSELPMPDCRVSGDGLLVWFGDEAAPVLAFPRIALH
jgi:hypothetical protein